MNYKKLIASSIVVIAALSMQANAKELQAQVQKSTANKAKTVQSASVKSSTQVYPAISKLIEYNHCEEADEQIRQLLNVKPNDINLLALRTVSMAKQHKLDPAQKELDKLLKQYPKNPTLHYAQGLVYLQRTTSSDVAYIKNTRGWINNSIREFVTAVNLNSKYYEACNAVGVATLILMML